jgi:uncharacterized membrane protein
MKEKILQKLKTAVSDGKNGLSSIAEKTLETYAEIYGKKITGESQVDVEVETIVSALKAVQANINSVSAKAVSEREKALKAEHEKALETLKTPGTQEEPDGIDAKIKAALEVHTKELREKLATYEVTAREQERRAEIASGMKELGLTEDDMEYVTVPEGRDIREFLAGYRQRLVDRGLKPLGKSGTQTADPKDAAEAAKGLLERIAVPEK